MKTQIRVLVCTASALLVSACGNSPVRPQASAGDNAASINVSLGIEYLRKGNLAVAKEKLERAEKQNPRDANVHNALGLLYEQLDKPAQADSHYRTAVRLAPQDPDISNNYAIYLCKTNRAAEGVQRFLEAARNRLYRTPEAAYTNAGVCLRKAGKTDEAAANFKRALQTRPNYAEAAYQLGELEMDRGHAAAARAQVDQYLGAFDATADLLLLGAKAAHATGDRLAAERYARRLRVEFPNSAQVRALPDLTQNPG